MIQREGNYELWSHDQPSVSVTQRYVAYWVKEHWTQSIKNQQLKQQQQ